MRQLDSLTFFAIVILANSFNTEALNWSKWGEFGPCTRPCGGGEKTRHRVCPRPGMCSGANKDTRDCNEAVCLANAWTRWSAYGPCKLDCKIERHRIFCTTTQCPLKLMKKEVEDEDCTGHLCGDEKNTWNTKANNYVIGWDNVKKRWKPNFYSPIKPGSNNEYVEGYIPEENRYSEGWNVPARRWYPGYDKDNRAWRPGFKSPFDPKTGELYPGFNMVKNSWNPFWSRSRNRWTDGYNPSTNTFQGVSPMEAGGMNDNWNEQFADWYPGYDPSKGQWQGNYYNPGNSLGFDFAKNQWRDGWDLASRSEKGDTSSEGYDDVLKVFSPGYNKQTSQWEPGYKSPIINRGTSDKTKRYSLGFLYEINQWNPGWDIMNGRWKEGFNNQFGTNGEWFPGYDPINQRWKDGYADPNTAPNSAGMFDWSQNKWKLGWNPVTGNYHKEFDVKTGTWTEGYDPIAGKFHGEHEKRDYTMYIMIAAGAVGILLLMCCGYLIYSKRTENKSHHHRTGEGSLRSWGTQPGETAKQKKARISKQMRERGFSSFDSDELNSEVDETADEKKARLIDLRSDYGLSTAHNAPALKDDDGSVESWATLDGESPEKKIARVANELNARGIKGFDRSELENIPGETSEQKKHRLVALRKRYGLTTRGELGSWTSLNGETIDDLKQRISKKLKEIGFSNFDTGVLDHRRDETHLARIERLVLLRQTMGLSGEEDIGSWASLPGESLKAKRERVAKKMQMRKLKFDEHDLEALAGETRHEMKVRLHKMRANYGLLAGAGALSSELGSWTLLKGESSQQQKARITNMLKKKGVKYNESDLDSLAGESYLDKMYRFIDVRKKYAKESTSSKMDADQFSIGSWATLDGESKADKRKRVAKLMKARGIKEYQIGDLDSLEGESADQKKKRLFKLRALLTSSQGDVDNEAIKTYRKEKQDLEKRLKAEEERRKKLAEQNLKDAEKWKSKVDKELEKKKRAIQEKEERERLKRQELSEMEPEWAYHAEEKEKEKEDDFKDEIHQVKIPSIFH